MKFLCSTNQMKDFLTTMVKADLSLLVFIFLNLHKYLPIVLRSAANITDYSGHFYFYN